MTKRYLALILKASTLFVLFLSFASSALAISESFDKELLKSNRPMSPEAGCALEKAMSSNPDKVWYDPKKGCVDANCAWGHMFNGEKCVVDENFCKEHYSSCLTTKNCAKDKSMVCYFDCEYGSIGDILGCGACKKDSDCSKLSTSSFKEWSCFIRSGGKSGVCVPADGKGKKIKCKETEDLKDGKCVCLEFYEDSSGNCPEPIPLTKDECNALKNQLKNVLDKFEGKISINPDDFWEKIGSYKWDVAKIRSSNWFGKNGLHYEDGYKKPIRTGYEVDFYSRLKDFIVKNPRERIGPAKLLEIGLQTAYENGNGNLQTALLTIHNVVRFLARPQQWVGDSSEGKPTMAGDYGHPPDDPMYPLFRELRGYESTDEKPPLLDILGFKRKPNRTPTDAQWTFSLFDPQKGLFETLPGGTNRIINAGNHYYFWIGAVADTVLTSRMAAAEFGLGKEKSEGLKGKLQTKVQIGLGHCGALFGEEAMPEKSMIKKVGQKIAVVGVKIATPVLNALSWTKNKAVDLLGL